MKKNIATNPVFNAGWLWEISSEKQSNGLWGMPMQCYKMDKMVMSLSEEDWLKHSAFCIGVAEAYRDETFEICFSDETGFCVKLSKSGYKRLNYKDYELKDNILRWAGKREEQQGSSRTV